MPPGLVPGVLSALAAALARSAAKESWQSRPPFHSWTITWSAHGEEWWDINSQTYDVQLG